MRHPLQILPGYRLLFGQGQARYQGDKIGEKSYRLGS